MVEKLEAELVGVLVGETVEAVGDSQIADVAVFAGGPDEGEAGAKVGTRSRLLAGPGARPLRDRLEIRVPELGQLAVRLHEPGGRLLHLREQLVEVGIGAEHVDQRLEWADREELVGGGVLQPHALGESLTERALEARSRQRTPLLDPVEEGQESRQPRKPEVDEQPVVVARVAGVQGEHLTVLGERSEQ